MTFVLLISQAYLLLSLRDSEIDSKLINVSGRQRMLSQQISKICLKLINPEFQSQRTQQLQDLDSISSLFNESHLYLTDQAIFNLQIKTLFERIGSYQRAIFLSAQSIIEKQDQNLIKEEINKVLASESVFLKLMNDITNELERYANHKVILFSNVEYFLLVVTISSIALVILTFRPLIKSVFSQQIDNEKLMLAINSLEDHSVFYVDHTGKMKSWNPASLKMYGYNQEEMKNKNILSLFSKKKNLPWGTEIKTDPQETYQMQDWQVKKDQSFFYASVFMRAIHGNKGELPGYSVVIRDLTDIRDAERSRMLEIRNKELEQYTYIISHDLQEPLRTIRNYIDVIEEDYAGQLNGTLSKYLNRINQAAMRLQRLVHELLDYSRIGKKSTPQKLPVGGLIRNVIDDLEGHIKEKQATITLAEKFPELWVYELEIQQLFQNLISNALKYSKKNVKSKIGIDVKEMEEHWHFTVDDNGIGVDQSSYETIFEIFRRAQHTKDYEGSGIGLAHCKKITELHDGQIGVESIVGEGSTFFFTISKFLEFNKESQNDRG